MVILVLLYQKSVLVAGLGVIFITFSSHIATKSNSSLYCNKKNEEKMRVYHLEKYRMKKRIILNGVQLLTFFKKSLTLIFQKLLVELSYPHVLYSCIKNL